MARMSKQKRLEEIHRDALQEFDEIQAASRQERLQCLQDRRFYSITGAQWEGEIGEQFENKPRFEFNKVHLAVIRIFNEYRNNRITVDFQPKDGSSDEMADTCDGLYRADEKACTADEAYDNCFEEGVGGGFGAWRLRACYEDEDDDDNEQQRVVIEPIFDADSTVFFNLAAKRYDKADAERCFVLTPYPRRTYEEEFGDDVSSWPHTINQFEFDWCTPDLVWVCELYRVEEESEMVRFFRGLLEGEPDMQVAESELEEDPNKLAELLAMGFREVRQKRVRRRKIMKYTMTGGKIFEKGEHKPMQIAGRCIPVIPFYGKRWMVDGVERCMGQPQIAVQLMRERADAMEASGQTREAEALRANAGVVELNPALGLGMVQALLSANPRGKDAAEALTKFGTEQRAAELHPTALATAEAGVVKANADAQTAVVGAKFAESKAVQDLKLGEAQIKKLAEDTEIARMNARIAAMNAATAREGNDLKRQELSLKVNEAIEKRDEKVREKVQTAQAGAANIDNMLNTIQRIQNNKSLNSVVGSMEGNSYYPNATLGSINPFGDGDERADAIALIETLGSQAFLAQIPNIKGMGALSNAEGEKLQSAFQNLSRKQSEKQFRDTLNEASRLLNKARNSLAKGSGVDLGKPDTPAAPGARPPLSSFQR